MSWWGSWFGLLVGGTLIWHAFTGTVLPSYSTDSHCPGNRSSSSRTQSTHRFLCKIHAHSRKHTHARTHAHPSLSRQCSFWSRFGTSGDRWVNSGSLGCHHLKSKGMHAHSHTPRQTRTDTHRQDHRLNQTWSESGKHTNKMHTVMYKMLDSHTQIQTRTHASA